MADPNPCSRRSRLVIGYGNELRSDDAVGPRLARLVEDLALPNVEVLAVHQLTPELADLISQAGAVVLIDASVRLPPGCVEVRTVHAANTPTATGHACTPELLLAFAETLFGNVPPAKLVRIGVATLEVGDRLSVEVEAALPAALLAVTDVLRARTSRP